VTVTSTKGLGASDALALSLPTRNCSGPGELVRLARGAEGAGYSSVLLAERVTETFSLCQELLHATTGIQVGTAVANARLRHPVAAAMAAMNLETMSGGRFVLGLGIANAALNERRLGLEAVATLRWMREYVAVFKRSCAGGPIDFDGTYFRIQALELDDSAAVAVPLHLAALRPGMQRLAARVADGVILNLCPVDSLPAALANLETGIEQREPGLRPPAVSCVVPCCVSEDAERARAAAREVLLDYTLHPSAARLFAADAGAELVATVQSDLIAGRRKRAAERLPEAFVDRFVAAGSPADCAERLVAYRRGGVDTPIVFPRPVDDDWASTTWAVAECYRRILDRPDPSRPRLEATAPTGAAPPICPPQPPGHRNNPGSLQ
jgi:5,10-methylenetetrahydromethanopterin reductase